MRLVEAAVDSSRDDFTFFLQRLYNRVNTDGVPSIHTLLSETRTSLVSSIERRSPLEYYSLLAHYKLTEAVIADVQGNLRLYEQKITQARKAFAQLDSYNGS